MRANTKAGSRSDYWRGVISEQERSGLRVRSYCEQRGVALCSFYEWRRRLREEAAPVRFALVESAVDAAGAEPLELILATGERLRITAGTDVAFLRRVVEGLRS